MFLGAMPRYATLNAPDVPTINAARSFLAQAEPTLFAAPSPIAGNQSALASLGQRRANFLFNRNVWPSAASFGRFDFFIFKNLMRSVSQLHSHISKIPVADAIETLVDESPQSFRAR